MDMKRIGKNIADLRKGKGYTQDTLAEKLNISAQAISKWETGACFPEVTLLIELSELFRVSVDDIICADRHNNNISSFINRNIALPEKKTLKYIPKIDRWNPPDGCDMYYSMPAMIAEALCCIDAQEKCQPEIVTMAELNNRFRELMHIMGVGYGFLWLDERHMIEELWRINDLYVMADRVMRYYGRDYVWLTNENSTPDDMRRIIIWSIDKGRPVVMENVAGIPEFSIVTGYEDNGNTLIGWTYCGECATNKNELGMFVNPARWSEKYNFHALVIGDKIKQTLSNKDTIEFALEILDKKKSDNIDFAVYEAGDAALIKWLEACDSIENTVKLFTISDIFTHALYMNSIYTQKCVLQFYKKLANEHNRHVNDIVIQIDIAINRIEGERNGLNSLKDNPKAYVDACRHHIENLIKHRECMRRWLKQIYELL